MNSEYRYTVRTDVEFVFVLLGNTMDESQINCSAQSPILLALLVTDG